MPDKELQLCRVCLIDGVRMYKLDGQLRESYLSIFKKNSWSEQLPQFICYQCLSLMQKFLDFKCRCQQAEHIFMQLLNDFKEVRKDHITNEHRKSVQRSLSPITLGEDKIIYFSYNEDISVLTPVEIMISLNEVDTFSDDENKEDLVPKNEPESDNELFKNESHIGKENNFDDLVENDASSPKPELAEVWTEELKCKNLRLSPKKKKHKKIKEIEKKKKSNKKVSKPKPGKNTEKKEEIRDKDGLKPEEADLKTHFNITFLTLKEQKAEIERRKETANYIQSPYKCNVCYKGFHFENTLTNHMAKHQPEWGEFECPVCGIRFPIGRFLRTHLRTHERIYACTMCHYVTTHLDPAKKHKQWHTGVTYTCEHCGEVSKKHTSHLNHVRTKHPSQFVCSYCGFSFISEKGLKMHVSISHRNDAKEPEKESGDAVSSWKCDGCSLTFRSEAAWRRHHATQHSTHSEAKLPLCRVCGVRFPSVRELRAHNASRHAESVAARAEAARGRKFPSAYPLPCEQCGEEIASRKKHWRHYQKYHFEKPYPLLRNFICELCGKGFNNNAQLVYHRRTHFPERSFVCPQCPKSFHNRGNLSLHTLTHNTQRPYACDYCGKCFKSKLGLTIHLKKVCFDNGNGADDKKGQRKSGSPKPPGIKRRGKRKESPLRNL